jgi:hypothetical protein
VGEHRVPWWPIVLSPPQLTDHRLCANQQPLAHRLLSLTDSWLLLPNIYLLSSKTSSESLPAPQRYRSRANRPVLACCWCSLSYESSLGRKALHLSIFIQENIRDILRARSCPLISSHENFPHVSNVYTPKSQNLTLNRVFINRPRFCCQWRNGRRQQNFTRCPFAPGLTRWYPSMNRWHLYRSKRSVRKEHTDAVQRDLYTRTLEAVTRLGLVTVDSWNQSRQSHSWNEIVQVLDMGRDEHLYRPSLHSRLPQLPAFPYWTASRSYFLSHGLGDSGKPQQLSLLSILAPAIAIISRRLMHFPIPELSPFTFTGKSSTKD